MECIQNTLGLFHVIIWEGAHRKYLARGGTQKLTGQTFCQSNLKTGQIQFFAATRASWQQHKALEFD